MECYRTFQCLQVPCKNQTGFTLRVLLVWNLLLPGIQLCSKQFFLNVCDDLYVSCWAI